MDAHHESIERIFIVSSIRLRGQWLRRLLVILKEEVWWRSLFCFINFLLLLSTKRKARESNTPLHLFSFLSSLSLSWCVVFFFGGGTSFSERSEHNFCSVSLHCCNEVVVGHTINPFKMQCPSNDELIINQTLGGSHHHLHLEPNAACSLVFENGFLCLSIFSSLDFVDLVACASVCRSFNALSGDASLWIKLLERKPSWFQEWTSGIKEVESARTFYRKQMQFYLAWLHEANRKDGRHHFVSSCVLPSYETSKLQQMSTFYTIGSSHSEITVRKLFKPVATTSDNVPHQYSDADRESVLLAFTPSLVPQHRIDTDGFVDLGNGLAAFCVRTNLLFFMDTWLPPPTQFITSYSKASHAQAQRVSLDGSSQPSFLFQRLLTSLREELEQPPRSLHVLSTYSSLINSSFHFSTRCKPAQSTPMVLD